MLAARRKPVDRDAALRHHRQGPGRQFQRLLPGIPDAVQHFHAGALRRQFHYNLFFKPGERLDRLSGL